MRQEHDGKVLAGGPKMSIFWNWQSAHLKFNE